MLTQSGHVCVPTRGLLPLAENKKEGSTENRASILVCPQQQPAQAARRSKLQEGPRDKLATAGRGGQGLDQWHTMSPKSERQTPLSSDLLPKEAFLSWIQKKVVLCGASRVVQLSHQDTGSSKSGTSAGLWGGSFKGTCTLLPLLTWIRSRPNHRCVFI